MTKAGALLDKVDEKIFKSIGKHIKGTAKEVSNQIQSRQHDPVAVRTMNPEYMADPFYHAYDTAVGVGKYTKKVLRGKK
jgi:hypothetical protein